MQKMLHFCLAASLSSPRSCRARRAKRGLARWCRRPGRGRGPGWRQWPWRQGWAGWSRRGRRVPQQGWAVGTGLQVDTHSSVIRQGNNTAARLRLVVRGTPLNATLWLLLVLLLAKACQRARVCTS